MFFNDEVNTALRAYRLSVLPVNANWKYLRNNSLEHGICHFCDINKLNLLNEFLRNEDFFYLCDTPTHLYARNEFNFTEILNRRIEYLEKLLIIGDCAKKNTIII
jgi:hypothetical protein